MSREDAITRRRDELLSVKEFSDVTRIHLQSVYRMLREGRLRGVYRFGSEIRIDITASRLDQEPQRQQRQSSRH